MRHRLGIVIGWALAAATGTGVGVFAADEPVWVDVEPCLPEAAEVGADFVAPWTARKLTRAAWLEAGGPFAINPFVEATVAMEAALGASTGDVAWPGVAGLVDFATGMPFLPAEPPPPQAAPPTADAAPTPPTPDAKPAPPPPKVPVATARAEAEALRKALEDCVTAVYQRSKPRSDVWAADTDEVSVVVMTLRADWVAAHAADLDHDAADLARLSGYATATWAATKAAGKEDLAHWDRQQRELNAEITNLEQALKAATDERTKAGVFEAIQNAQKRLKDVQSAMKGTATRGFSTGDERLAAADLDAGSVRWARVAASNMPPTLNVTARARVGRLFAIVRRAATGSYATDAAVAETKALVERLAKDRMRPALAPR
ncbi:MAG: hypothetical protein IT460_05695 [Planctomycetes bacterium]|nr:hypothetical protein [Planctomycetota bacterium]